MLDPAHRRRAGDAPGAPQLHLDGNVLRHLQHQPRRPGRHRRRRRRPARTRSGMQDQAFLGPESGLAIPDERGRRRPLHRDPVAARRPRPGRRLPRPPAGEGPADAWPASGGAFGGREDLSMQIHACMLALHTGRPVKIVYNREESFFGHVHRHPAKHALRARRRPRRHAGLRRARGCSSTAAPTRRARHRRRLQRRLLRRRSVRGPEREARRATSPTRTTRRAARCAASARSRSRSPHEAQMDKLARLWTWTRSSCGSRTRM